jgi:hypothetical protein
MLNSESKCPAEFFEPIHSFFDHIQAGRIAQPDGSVVSEGDSWNDRDVCLTKEAIGEIL